MRSSEDDKTIAMRPTSMAVGCPPVQAPPPELFADWSVLSVLADGSQAHFPEVGDRFADCLLLAELGRGSEGRVFLASQADLGDRLIVLKVTPSRGGEHLALARLVHTHIAPLLFARELPEAGLRVLAMPFVGGTSLLEVRDQLRQRSAPFSGRNVVEIFARSGPERPTPAGSRHLLERLRELDAPTFAAWLGACLADGLGHAHERGLMHLDVKPGNVLLAADGTPLLLDFHLAQEQFAAGATPPETFGGTEAYMAPEQKAAGMAFHSRARSPVAVDGRADLFALGVLLFEMLAGDRPDEAAAGDRLRRSGASRGLRAILAKCMRADPNRRYASAALLADDLRRHLTNRPLRGVPNHDLGERWRKWRRRNPDALRQSAVAALVVVALAVGLFAAGHSALEARRVALEATEEARRLRDAGDHPAAVRLLERTPRPGEWSEVAGRFDAEREAAHREDRAQRTRRRRAELAGDLTRLANELRLGWDLGRWSASQTAGVARRCAALWDRRDELTATPLSAGEREELIEVALVLSSLERNEARLDEAEAALGKEAALDAERARLRGGAMHAYRDAGQATPWENYWAGRTLLRAGKTAEARRRFAAAEEARPDAVWPCFYRGVCAFRLGDHREAERAFRVCEALLPRSAEVCVDRAAALMGLRQLGEARACLDRAIAMQPELGEAWFQRGVLSAREGDRPKAIADLERGLTAHAPAGPTHFNLALLFHEGGRPNEAREHLRLALEAMPGDAEALRLGRKMEAGAKTRKR